MKGFSAGALTGVALLVTIAGGCAADRTSPTALETESPAPASVAQPAPTSTSSPAGSDALGSPALTETALTDLIDPEALRAQLEAFQAIADANGGNRSTGTPGFDASVEHVAAALEAAEYVVERQPFEVGGVTSTNVLAERAGTGDGLFVLGAHVDSVVAGAGLNDNASGVAALLVVAEALTHLAPPDATIRFAFWGAEEGGPFGSAAYVAALDSAAIAAIGGYLNFDMLGSPNGLAFVYDEPGAAPGSEALTTLVASPFQRRGLPWEPIDLTGRRRPRPLHRCGHPHRRPLQRGPRARDRCAGRPPWRQSPASRQTRAAIAACDTIANVDLARLARMTDAIAAIVAALATEED